MARTTKPAPALAEPGATAPAPIPVPEGTRPSLPLALLNAQRLVIGVSQSSKADFTTSSGGRTTYNYTSCEDMLTAARGALLAAGLVLTRQHYHVSTDSPWTDRNMLVCDFLLEHPASGEYRHYPNWTWPIVPGRGRDVDKATAGALSNIWTYFLRDLLLVPRPEDNEMDKRQHEDEEPGRPQRRAQTQQPAAQRRVEITPEEAEGIAAEVILDVQEQTTVAAARARANAHLAAGLQKIKAHPSLRQSAVEAIRRHIADLEAAESGGSVDEELPAGVEMHLPQRRPAEAQDGSEELPPDTLFPNQEGDE